MHQPADSLPESSRALIANDTIFVSPSHEIEFYKPKKWHWVSAEQNKQNLDRTKLEDKKADSLVKKSASAPVVAIMKYEEPFDDVNPSIKVDVKPLGPFQGKSPAEVLQVLIPTLQKVLLDMKIEVGPVDTTFNGMPAGYCRSVYTLKTNEDRDFQTCSELWVVPRASYLYFIGTGTRKDEKTGTRKEIQSILGRLKIK